MSGSQAIKTLLLSCCALALAFVPENAADAQSAAEANSGKACFGEKCVRSSRSKYLGDFCWVYSFTEGEGPFKVGVFHLGGRHFLLSGLVREGDGEFIVKGNAEYIGEDLILFLQAPGGGLDVEVPIPDSEDSQFVNVVGQATFFATLDPETLEGQALLFETNTFEEAEGFESGVSYGGPLALTPADCETLSFD